MKEKGDRNWYVYGKQWLNVHQGINIEMISMEEITQKKIAPICRTVWYQEIAIFNYLIILLIIIRTKIKNN